MGNILILKTIINENFVFKKIVLLNLLLSLVIYLIGSWQLGSSCNALHSHPRSVLQLLMPTPWVVFQRPLQLRGRLHWRPLPDPRYPRLCFLQYWMGYFLKLIFATDFPFFYPFLLKRIFLLYSETDKKIEASLIQADNWMWPFEDTNYLLWSIIIINPYPYCFAWFGWV